MSGWTRKASTPDDSASEKSRDVNDSDEDSENHDNRAGDQRPNDVEKGNPPPSQPEESHLVVWDGPEDPNNPQNWPTARKCRITAVAAFMTFVASFGSSVFSTATEVTAKRFNVSNEVMILGVTLYLLGFAAGKLSPETSCHVCTNSSQVRLIGLRSRKQDTAAVHPL